jgi:uncharacterized membrane protein YgaE (UPF0421/DUF939 family)
MNSSIFSGTKTGTAGGTAMIILANIHSSDLIRTAILAAVGAAVSFLVSFLLRELIRKLRS